MKKYVLIMTDKPPSVYMENLGKKLSEENRRHNSQCKKALKAFHNAKGWKR